MADSLTLTVCVRRKWWFGAAFIAATLLVRLGLIRDKHSADHKGGRISATERASIWLVDHGLVLSVS